MNYSCDARRPQKDSVTPKDLLLQQAEPFFFSHHRICNKKKRQIRENANVRTSQNKETFRDKVFNYEKNKEWKYEGTLPALVDFWAPWCGPCRLVGPVIDELSKEYHGKANFYKVNTEEEQELAGMFEIQSISRSLYSGWRRAEDGVGCVAEKGTEKND